MKEILVVQPLWPEALRPDDRFSFAVIGDHAPENALRRGTGTDDILVDRRTVRGLPATVVGGVDAVSVAGHTMPLTLAAARHVVAFGAALVADPSVPSSVRGGALHAA